MAQGGDITKEDGTGGESIYGQTFADENFSVLHDREGVVGMANQGPNTNGSQFYIVTVPCPHLDETNVAFGIVRKGLNIVREMEEISRINDTPSQPIVIEDCGEIKPGEDWGIGEKDATEDIYPPWPHDWEINTEDDGVIENAINKIKDSGNYFFKEKNYVDSERKYIKALRYINWFIGLSKNTNSSKVDEVKMSALLNLAAVSLKRNKYKQVVDLCDEVLSKEPNNAKALYRRGCARLKLLDYDKALKDLTVSGNLIPNDANIKAVLKEAKKMKKSYLQQEKQFYGNFFK